MVQNTFYCIQPIQLSKKFLSLIHDVTLDKKLLQSFTNEKFEPSWKKKIDSFYSAYENIKGIQISQISASKVKEEAIAYSKNYNIFHFSSLESFLLYDFAIHQFVLVYKLDASVKAFDILKIQSNQIDFYNLIRNLFVKEQDTSDIVSNSIAEHKAYVLNKITMFIEDMFSIPFTTSDVSLLNNTGNITNVSVVSKELSSFKRDFIGKFLIEANHNAERVRSKTNKAFLLEDINQHIDNNTKEVGEYYFFGGRFHTIFLFDDCDAERYIPIQFYMQSMWFLLDKQLHFFLNGDYAVFPHLERFLERLDYIEAYNKKFKMSLEADIEIYNKVEKKWNIEDSLAHLFKAIKDAKENSLQEVISLKKSVYTDFLTSCHTRKWLEDNLLDMNNRFKDKGALCVIDLNEFKIVNDSYGHSVGDDMLRYFSTLLSKTTGEVVRFGGDEFIVVFSELEHGRGEIEKVLKIVSEKLFKVSLNKNVNVSFSFGFAEFEPSQLFSHIFEVADGNMYQYKQSLKR